MTSVLVARGLGIVDMAKHGILYTTKVKVIDISNLYTVVEFATLKSCCSFWN